MLKYAWPLSEISPFHAEIIDRLKEPHRERMLCVVVAWIRNDRKGSIFEELQSARKLNEEDEYRRNTVG